MEQQEIEAFRESVKQLQESLQALSGSAQKADLTISDELGKKFPNAAKPAMAALSGLGNAITDVTAALYKGERGMTVMANGIDKLVDGLQAAAAIFTIFTPMGKALSLGSKLLINGVAAAAKGVSSANKLNAEQSDRLYKVYQNLSDVGAAGAGGLEKLFDTMQQAGFTVAELDQFANALKKNSRDLTNFGATTAEGAENLAKMSGGILKGDLGLALSNLGYTSESLANSTANYIALQNQLGRVQLKTATQLQKEATAYAIELDRLTRLTGLSREEQEKRQRSLINDERYASFISTEAKRQGYDVGKLTEFFSLIEDENTRKGLQHMMAGGGMSNSEEARRIMMTDPMAYERMMRVARGGSAVGEAQGFYGAAKQYMGPGGIGGELGRYTGAGPGISVSANLEFTERMDQMGAAARKAGMTLEDFVKSEQGKAMLDKGRLNDQNKLRLQQLGAAQALDSTVNKFTLLNSVTDSLSTAFTNLTTKLGGKVAGGVPGATPTAGAAQGLAGLRELIASKESGGNYNVMVGGQTADLTNMTIAQVMELQKKRVAGGQGSAAGKYQIINKTLEGLVKEGNIDTGAKFDQAMQDRLADMLIQRRGYTDFQTGKISKEQFAKNLSQEWAAFPSGPGNQSYYQGVGNNKAGYTWDQVMQNLTTAPAGPSGAFGFNGTLSGPMSGYRPNLLMHGTEDISIRPSSGVPGTDSAAATDGAIMQLIGRVDELIDVSKSQLSTSQRILKYQQ